MAIVTRAPSGHRCGQSHPRARVPDAVVRQARELREQGLSYEAIEYMIGIHWRTVADWVNYRTRINA